MPRIIAPNWVDWVTLAIVLVSVVRAIRYGVLASAADLVVLVVSFLIASLAYATGGDIVRQYLPMMAASWARLIAFVVVWLVCYLPTSRLLRLLLENAPFPLIWVFGPLIGLLRGVVLATVILVVALAAPFRDVVAEDAAKSLIGPSLLSGNDRVLSALLPALEPVRVPRVGPGGEKF